MLLNAARCRTATLLIEHGAPNTRPLTGTKDSKIPTGNVQKTDINNRAEQCWLRPLLFVSFPSCQETVNLPQLHRKKLSLFTSSGTVACMLPNKSSHRVGVLTPIEMGDTMKNSLSLLLCVTLVMLLPVASHAQINGFNFLQGFALNQLDSGASVSVGQDFVDLTSGPSQGRNIWFNTRQPISEFSASFRYQTADFGLISGFESPGVSFIIQNSPAGLEATTNSVFGAGFTGIDQSVALVFDLTSYGGVDVSFQENGSIGTGGSNLGARNTFGDGLDVTLDYDGTLLNIVIDDGIEDPFTQSLLIDPTIAESLGSGDAFIGFGASTMNSLFGLGRQTLSNFQFSAAAGPVPGATGDFDGDGDVDCDDLDGFINNLGEAATGALAELDIDGDGVLSEEDADSHIATLVVTSVGVTGTVLGDLNCDGEVNVLIDAFALVASLGNAVTTYAEGDLNFDGQVTVLGDAFTLVGNLGASNAAP